MFKVFKKAQDIQPRVFYANSRESSKRFCDNRIKTSRYNFITFLPLFLIDQFKKAANLYFLFVSLLQQIPGVSPIGRFITLSVLVGILIVLAVKEIIEDIVSLILIRNDILAIPKLINSHATIHVGDIIRVESGQIVPADIVIISTSEPNHNCYIQTSSLDGEISYKIKYVCQISLLFLSTIHKTQ
ncbi:Phospholipid-transporting ATPase IB [Thelohanellus kitauei]|uniref:Phospholipid-transporting ATPase IB n=1 Tax=Thelohanellus kitauei TaxID=669202 RepID=A0A0C2JJX4_THEKT|nr:Phospholipid-transporting ATPase IB [Thelohanellus kitauei]